MDTKTRVWLERAAFVVLGMLLAIAYSTYHERNPIDLKTGAAFAPDIPWQESDGRTVKSANA